MKRMCSQCQTEMIDDLKNVILSTVFFNRALR